MKALLAVLALLAVASAAHAQSALPTASPLDGEWRGRSDGGSCNAPLDYVLSIDAGIVDGSATDITAHGPAPNTKHAPPPPPMAGLWQIHGLARPTGDFPLLSVASVTGTNRLEGKLSARSDGNALLVRETGGCRRSARLTR
jgi:hypothetical protein